MKKPDRRAVCLVVLLSLQASLVAAYQIEAELGWKRSDIKILNEQTDRSRQESTVSFYQQPVSMEEGPWGEAAFLAHTSMLTLYVADGEDSSKSVAGNWPVNASFEDSASTSSDRGFAGEIVAGSLLAGFSYYSDSSDSAELFANVAGTRLILGTGSVTGGSIWIGNYIHDSARWSLAYSAEDDDAEDLAIILPNARASTVRLSASGINSRTLRFRYRDLAYNKYGTGIALGLELEASKISDRTQFFEFDDEFYTIAGSWRHYLHQRWSVQGKVSVGLYRFDGGSAPDDLLLYGLDLDSEYFLNENWFLNAGAGITRGRYGSDTEASWKDARLGLGVRF